MRVRAGAAAVLLAAVAGCAQAGSVEVAAGQSTPAPTLPAASSSTAAMPEGLAGPLWALESITTDGKTWQGPAEPRFELSFAATSFAGRNGCNWVGGPAAYSAGTVQLSQGSSTLMLCEGPGIERMATAFTLLAKAPVRVSVSAGVLELSGSGQVLRLRPDPLDHQLGARKWTLRSVTQGGKTLRLAYGLRDGFLFAHGAVDGNDGCSDWTASATYETSDIHLGAVHRAGLGCSDDRVSAGVKTLLAGEIHVVIDGTSLTLTGHGVRLVLDDGSATSSAWPINAEPANPSGTIPPPSLPSAEPSQ